MSLFTFTRSEGFHLRPKSSDPKDPTFANVNASQARCSRSCRSGPGDYGLPDARSSGRKEVISRETEIDGTRSGG